MITKKDVLEDIEGLETLWGAGHPDLFNSAVEHEKALRKLLKLLVARTPAVELRRLAKKAGYDVALAAYIEDIEAT